MSDISSTARLGTTGALRSYNIRSSGRDLNAVRRPVRVVPAAKKVTAPAANLHPAANDATVKPKADTTRKADAPRKAKPKKADRG